jgi:hypothetical protein
LSDTEKERALLVAIAVAVLIIIWMLLHRRGVVGGEQNITLGGVNGPVINVGDVTIGGLTYDPGDYSWLFGDNTNTHTDCSCGCSPEDNQFFAGLEDAMNSYIDGMSAAQTAYMQAMWGNLPPSYTQYLLNLTPDINNPASWGSN